jgi:hypothetical protein
VRGVALLALTLFAAGETLQARALPWSFVFAPDGRLFATERPGRVQIIDITRHRNSP